MNKTTTHNKAESNRILKQLIQFSSIASLLWIVFCFGQTVQENKDNVKLNEQSNKYNAELNEQSNKHTVEIVDYKIKLSKYENDSLYKK